MKRTKTILLVLFTKSQNQEQEAAHADTFASCLKEVLVVSDAPADIFQAISILRLKNLSQTRLRQVEMAPPLMGSQRLLRVLRMYWSGARRSIILV